MKFLGIVSDQWFDSVLYKEYLIPLIRSLSPQEVEKLTADLMDDRQSTLPLQSRLQSILPSPPLSAPLLWLSLFPPCITQPPLGGIGQGAGPRGQTQEQSTLCLSNALPPGPCPPGKVLSAGPGLLISC